MSKTAYPTQTDLNSFLTAAGVTVGSLDTATAINAGIAEFERRARRTMLAPAGTATRYYDPPDNPLGILDFCGDLAVLTSIVYRPQGGSATTWAQNTDYMLLAYNAGTDGLGYWGARFRQRWFAPSTDPFSQGRSIEVTGRWGYGTTMAEDAWEAMILLGASLVIPSYGLSLSGGRIRTADSGVERLYGEDPIGGARAEWRRRAESAIRRYQRWGLA